MTAIPEPSGVPCDFCGEYAAIMSVMNLSDYSQMKPCGNCAPVILRSIADAFDPPAPPAPDSIPDLARALDHATDDPIGAVLAVQGTPDPAEEGSAADHWASTANVRRSTHGHRTPAARARKPRTAAPPPPEGE